MKRTKCFVGGLFGLALLTGCGATLDGGDEEEERLASAASGTGLRGEYFDGMELTGASLQRTDPTVDFDWGSGAPAASVEADTFSVRWTGKLVPRFTESYTLETRSDDGVRLFVDGQLLIDDWTNHAVRSNTASVALTAGRAHDLKLEYYENKGKAVIQLLWSSARQAREIVPASQLRPPSTSPSTALVKWRPGHYMRFKGDNGELPMKTFLASPFTTGLVLSLDWKALEPSRDRYDFSRLAQVLALVKAANKSLILMVEDRCFNGCTGASSPAYLATDPAFHGGVEVMYKDKARTIPKGSVVRLWDPAVTERLIELYRAIGRQYDADPALTGVVIGDGESAIAIDRATTPGYTDNAYKTELRRMASEVHLALPRTVSFTGMNFLGGGTATEHLASIADHLATLGSSGTHHPDTHPYSSCPVYEVEKQNRGRLAIATALQTTGVRPDETEEQMYLFARDVLGSNFVIWNAWFTSQNASGQKRDPYITSYVLPVIERHRGAINTACPSSYPSCT